MSLPPTGPCAGAHRACPDGARATEWAGQRAMCARCAAERRRARNRRKSRGRTVDAIEQRLAERDAPAPPAEPRGPGRPALDPDGAVELRVRVTQAQAEQLDALALREQLLHDGQPARAKAVRWLIDLEAEVQATCTRLTVLLIALDVLDEVGTVEEVASLRVRIDALTADLAALRASLRAVQPGAMPGPEDDQREQDQANEDEARAEAQDAHQQGACDLVTCRWCRGDEP